jgi:hypothetical protein
MKNSVSLFVVAFVIVLAVLVLPVGFIWSLNVLFKLEIPYEFETVLAAFFLLTILSPSHRSQQSVS